MIRFCQNKLNGMKRKLENDARCICALQPILSAYTDFLKSANSHICNFNPTLPVNVAV